MKSSKSKKTEVFFFNEDKYIRAIGEVNSYCTSGNKLLAILKGHELTINSTVADAALFASLNELADIVMNEQRRRLKDVPDSAREQLIIKPTLNEIELIRNGMAKLAAYNSGIIPGDFMMFAVDKFIVDEIRLKEFFTIYKNEKLTEIERLANEFIEAWERLKNNSVVKTFDNIVNVYGIVHFDPYSETFTFNKKSPDLTTF